MARLAPRAGRSRPARRAHRRAPGRGARAARALRRAVPLQGLEGPAGAVEAEADRPFEGQPYGFWDPRWSGEAPRFGLRIPEAEALRPHCGRGGGARCRRSRTDTVTRRLVRDRAWGAHLPRGAERRRQDDPPRDPARTPRTGRGTGAAR